MAHHLPPIDAATLRRRLDDHTAVLVDIREPSEYAREHILGARLVPIGGFDAHDFDRDAGAAIVVHCRSGSRTAGNAGRILGRSFPEVYQLAGGIEAWKAAGLPTHVDRGVPIDLMRQVQIAAGLLILTGVLLGWLVTPWGFGLAAFVGAGLTFAGATGFCGMARILGLAPWNRRAARMVAG